MTEVLTVNRTQAPNDLGAAAYVDELLRRQRAEAQAYVDSLVKADAKKNPPSVASDIGNAAKGFARSALDATADTAEGIVDFGRAAVEPLERAVSPNLTEAERARRAAAPADFTSPGKAIPGFLRDLAAGIPINPKTKAQGGPAAFLASTVPEAAGGVLPFLAGGSSALRVAALGAAGGHTAGKRAGEASGASQAMQDANTYIQTLLGATAPIGPAGALTRPMGKLGGRLAGDFALGAGQSLIGQAGAKATITPEAEIDVPAALESGGALGAVGLGMHAARAGGERLAKRDVQERAVRAMADEGSNAQVEEAQPVTTLERQESGTLTNEPASVPLTPETRDQGEAFFDPVTEEWRVKVEEPAARGEVPAQQEVAAVPRGTETGGGRAAESLLRQNAVEGKVVQAPAKSTGHTFAEEFARLHGLEVEWVDAGKKLDFPGVYLDRRIALDVHSDPISLIHHEAVHALAKDDPVAFGKMLGEIRLADPEGFQKHLGEYEADFAAAGGGKVSEPRLTEEGAARFVERLSGYVSAAFQEPARLRALLEHNPGLVRRIVDRAVRMLQGMGVQKWKTSQQKALISLRLFAREAGEAGLKPNRAAELALKIRDAFHAIEGRDLPKETAAPEPPAQVTTPIQKRPTPVAIRAEPKAEPTPKVEEPSRPAGWEGYDPQQSVVEQLAHPKVREHLKSLIPLMGQAERGGMLMWDGAHVGRKVTGRTSWIAKSPWWMSRPGTAGAKVWQKLVERAISDKPGKFTENQREMLDFLIDQRNDQPLPSHEIMLREDTAKSEAAKAERESAQSEEAIADREAEGRPVIDEKGEEAPFAVKRKEDIDPLGFYSPLRRALESPKMPAKASGADWINLIRKAPGAKRDEIEWSGVVDFLEGKKNLTRQEVQDYLRENEVRVEEVTRGAESRSLASKRARVAGTMAESTDIPAHPYEPVYPGPSYRLPGGENYRELLLTLPDRPLSREAAEDLNAARAEHGLAGAAQEVAHQEYLKAYDVATKALRKDHITQEAAGSILRGRDTTRLARDAESGKFELNPDTKAFVVEAWDAADAWSLAEARMASAREKVTKLSDSIRGAQFTQGHWTEPNVLAHIRTTDRTDSQGRKTLFLEEVQSDWHQKGRDLGYMGSPEDIAAARRDEQRTVEPARAALKRLGDLGFDHTSQALGSVFHERADWKTRFDLTGEKEAADVAVIQQWIDAQEKLQRIASTKIPPAPFSQTWHELAMRRAIRYAAENGYEQVAWTRGIDQVKRYQAALRQAVDEIESTPAKKGSVLITGTKSGGEVFSSSVPLEGTAEIHGEKVRLEDVVGSELAKKIRADPDSTQTFKGDELTIGGKGMQTFYDEMLPRTVDRIGKQFGVEAGETKMGLYGEPDHPLMVSEMRQGGWGVWNTETHEYIQRGRNLTQGEALAELRALIPKHEIRAHSVALTPEMRASVMEEGQPRFAVKSKESDEGFAVPDDTKSAAFRRAIVNDLDRIEVIERAGPKKIAGDSLETMGRLFPGRSFGEVEKLRAQIWKPMKRTLRSWKIEPFKSTPEDPGASDFLYALAALKANETLANEHPKKYGTLINAGSGMSSVEADRIVQSALKGPKAEGYREIQRLNRALNQRRLDAWVDGGLMAASERAELIKRWGLDYVPFRTSEDPAVKIADVPARPKGFNVAGKEFRARKGRESKADSPLAFAFDTAEQAIDRAERNKFGQALGRWAEINSAPDFLRVETDANKIKDGEFRLSFKKNGEQRWLVTKDQGLYKAFKRIAPEPGVIKVLDKALGFLHSTIIKWNPAFPFYNFPKDLGTAAFKVGIEHGADWSAAVVKNAPAAARGAWKVIRDEQGAKGKWSEVYREARDAGALIGWNEQFDPTTRLANLQKAFDRGPVREAIVQLFDFAEDANRAIELGTRMATYDKARRSGKTKSEAAVIARKVTADFAQRGTWTPVARRLFLFFGAGVQGTREATMAIARNPMRGAAAFGAAMATGYALASLSRIFADEDENGGSRFDRLSDYTLAHKGGVMAGDRFYGIPLPWFWNVPYFLGTALEQMQNGERTARETFPTVATAALQAMSPIQGSDPMQALTPTLLRPLEEIATNKDYAGNPIRPEQSPFDKTPTPRSEQAFKSINPAIQGAMRALNRWTGGNPARAGMLDVSPADVEHVLKFIGGGLGANAWKAMEAGRKTLAGEEVTLPDIPIVRGFVAKPSKGSTSDLYYKNQERVLTSADEEKIGETPRDPELAELKPLAAKIDGLVSKLRRAKKESQLAGEDTTDIEEAIRELMVAFNREVRGASQSARSKPQEAASR